MESSFSPELVQKVKEIFEKEFDSNLLPNLMGKRFIRFNSPKILSVFLISQEHLMHNGTPTDS